MQVRTVDPSRRKLSTFVNTATDAPNALRMQGDLVQALTYYQSALSDLPTDDRRDLALSHDKIAQVLWLQGNRVQSLAELNAALTMWEGLASEQPGSIYWQVMRVVGRSKIASVTAAGQGAQPALLPDFISPASSERRLGEGACTRHCARPAFHLAAGVVGGGDRKPWRRGRSG
jgi:hypothetical protein